MIFGQLENLKGEQGGLAVALQQGLQYLQDTDLENIPLGKHEISGDDMFALVSEYAVEPKGNKQPESHEKYIDIQYIAWGEELISCSFLSSHCEIGKDERGTRDLIFYKQVGEEVDLVLRPGRYAIFFPSDIHRPGCQYEKPGMVKKIVIKIAVSLLG